MNFNFSPWERTVEYYNGLGELVKIIFSPVAVRGSLVDGTEDEIRRFNQMKGANNTKLLRETRNWALEATADEADELLAKAGINDASKISVDDLIRANLLRPHLVAFIHRRCPERKGVFDMKVDPLRVMAASVGHLPVKSRRFRNAKIKMHDLKTIELTFGKVLIEADGVLMPHSLADMELLVTELGKMFGFDAPVSVFFFTIIIILHACIALFISSISSFPCILLLNIYRW